MAWFSGKVSLGGFPDLAGAVNKLQESVKNMEKNFDTALGFEEKSESSNNEASGLWSSESPPKVEEEEAENDCELLEAAERADTVTLDPGKAESESEEVYAEPSESAFKNVKSDSTENGQQKEISDVVPSADSDSKEAKLETAEENTVEVTEPVPAESRDAVDMHEINDERKTKTEEILDKNSPVKSKESSDSQADTGNGPDEPMTSSLHSVILEETISAQELLLPTESVLENAKRVEVDRQVNDGEADAKEEIRLSSASAMSNSADSIHELEKVKMEMKMIESALQGAAIQAQRKSNEAEMESLREEYHQRVSTLERKVYASTKERDTLRREQNKKSDAAALLKEKDEIINQVMAEGEELSKKQAAQEAQIRN
ncbi:Golgin candidate 5 isoform 2 [Hibiscus syriacus]|uniref:Golgin candidate 5 isoform 2 n=1 Tax=Hibiscus syriacus TaxID=106335 RepID=A0A6A2YN43_HIBSY|nr:Golgin candidate 5 isoform 2 [Hibiscus syriacus]